MEPRALALFSVLCLSLLLLLGAAHAATAGAADGTERWGYVEVRPKAHLFWWHYKSPQAQRVSTPTNPWPTVLWLQGGPGASGVGVGNFLEVGPLDGDLKPRSSTWLHKADLIFVDNPVGVGYSYVEDDDGLLVTTDLQAAADMTTLLKALVKELATLQSSPLFIVAESYGGKYAATLGVSLVRAVRAGELKLTLGGVALGDSWISPEDFASSYGTLLLQVSRLDRNGADHANKDAQVVRQQIAAGQFKQAQATLNRMLSWIVVNSGHVDVYNFLLDAGMDPVAAGASASSSPAPEYSRYLESKSVGDSIQEAMNGAIKQKLKIIPKDVVWQAQSYSVYNALINDFMKPRIQEVDELLSYGVNVTVYNGQLDVICSAIGAEAWVEKLKWDGLNNFLALPRQPLYCGSAGATKGFVRSYKNLHFYWILGAGHFVPVDQPCIALDMIGNITQSPALSRS
ncbi:serine carboxypeptidase-like 51 [Hordeum vulgare subsp. vulgare]|uniref:Carboxypeptidase n=1 Tax=Hordeum vulgare subsp. vulgare TaxID=112509 RepID=A0A8I6WLP9_HORVV|nr:serine carboxypeptidase-like 51 [Hordeum vulgare subsp. vulgare]